MRRAYIIVSGVFLLLSASVEVRSQIFINEIVASNASGGYYDQVNDNYPDWIELYNSSDTDIDLGGYYLSDDLNERDKWQIPSGMVVPTKGYAFFIADDLDTLNHTNFKLSAEGESICLSNRDKFLIDSLVYLPQSTNISMGRMLDDFSVWAYYTSPTPNLENSTPGYTGKTESPSLNLPAGFYDSPVLIQMKTSSPSPIIRYTLDGNLPTQSSNLYEGPLFIQSNTVVNAIAFEEGKMNSDMVTHTYFVGEHVSLPVFSFSMPPGDVGYFPRKSETATHVEYFDENHNQVISQDIGARITGLVGIHPMRSFSLYARSNYGAKRLEHRFFKDRLQTSYKNLVLRNGGYQDYSYTYLRDGLIQSFINGYLDIEYQAYQPVVLFKNGSYLALMNMREKQNEFYVENNADVDKDNIDLLEYQTVPPIVVLNGDSKHYSAMMEFINASDLSVQSNMDYLETQMDVKSFLDYYMLQIYCANADWPDKNSKLWRPKTAGGKWRWMVFDVDYGYGFAFSSEVNMYEYLYNLDAPFYHNRPWVTVIFRKIMENEGVRNYYLQRFNGLLNTAFHPEMAVHMIDSLKAQIEPEIGRHIQKWGDKDYGIPTMELWQSYCDTLYDFAMQRPAIARRNMMAFYEVEDTVSVEMKSIGGTIYMNDLLYCRDSASGVFFKGIPMKVQAVPDPGYEFVRWLNEPDVHQVDRSFTPLSDTGIEAVFRPIYKNILDGTFSIDTRLSDTSEPYISRGDLIVPANIELSLDEGIKLLMPEGCNIYVYGKLTIKGAENNPVVIDSYSGSWGGICLNHATGTSVMTHLVLKHASTGGDPELYKGAISAYYSPINLQSVVIENVPGNPVFTQYSTTRVNNCRFHSLGTSDLINVKYADSAIVENSVFMDSRMPDTDAIDFDGVKGGVIRYNKIHNLVGENSDGIDIGEGAIDMQIYGNLITNCSDKGISIGQASSMDVFRNVIYQCNNGIAVKDFGSIASISNNTLVKNGIGISCYEKNPGKGAGSAHTLNTIIADSKLASIVERNDGIISVEYSISNTDLMPGFGNLFTHPELAAPRAFNFELLATSPCIDAGSPDSPLDKDGSVADIGACYVTSWAEIYKDLIINEYYSNSSPEDPEDWIEIYNKGTEAIDLSEWYLLDGGNSYFKLPVNIRVDSNSYLVICKDTSNFKAFFGSDRMLTGNFDFSLRKSRDLIALFDNQYSPVKSLVYDEDELWPDSKEKNRISVALIDTSLAITEGLNWRTAYREYGTPGYSNIPPRVSGLYLNEFSGADQAEYADEYGEYEDWIEIYNANDHEIDLGGLFLTDDIMRPAQSKVRQNVPDSTLIPVGGFLVVFADKEPDQGVMHMDFKIGTGGEELGLIQLIGLDTLILDYISFGELEPGLSLARQIDGGVPWLGMQFTPGRSNILANIEIPAELFASVYPNPVSDVLNIRLNTSSGDRTEIRIINALGQGVLYESGPDFTPGQVISLDISSLEPGIYFVKISSGELNSVNRIVVNR